MHCPRTRSFWSSAAFVIVPSSSNAANPADGSQLPRVPPCPLRPPIPVRAARVFPVLPRSSSSSILLLPLNQHHRRAARGPHPSHRGPGQLHFRTLAFVVASPCRGAAPHRPRCIRRVAALARPPLIRPTWPPLFTRCCVLYFFPRVDCCLLPRSPARPHLLRRPGQSANYPEGFSPLVEVPSGPGERNP